MAAAAVGACSLGIGAVPAAHALGAGRVNSVCHTRVSDPTAGTRNGTGLMADPAPGSNPVASPEGVAMLPGLAVYEVNYWSHNFADC